MTAAVATRADRLDELNAHARTATTLTPGEVRRLAIEARDLATEAHNLALSLGQVAHELETGEPF